MEGRGQGSALSTVPQQPNYPPKSAPNLRHTQMYFSRATNVSLHFAGWGLLSGFCKGIHMAFGPIWLDFALFIWERAFITFCWFRPFLLPETVCFLTFLCTNHSIKVVEVLPAWDVGHSCWYRQVHRPGRSSADSPLVCEVCPWGLCAHSTIRTLSLLVEPAIK